MKKIILLACSFAFFSVITNAQTQEPQKSQLTKKEQRKLEKEQKKQANLKATEDQAKAPVAAAAPQQASTPAPTSTPQDVDKALVITDLDHDFGKIVFGKPVSYDVVIKNISKQPVKIENVQVGCGCTTPKYDKEKTYAPGETFTISLGYNNASMGTFRKVATATFSGGMTKALQFHGEAIQETVTQTKTN